jgi:hypothetical protein
MNAFLRSPEYREKHKNTHGCIRRETPQFEKEVVHFDDDNCDGFSW